MSMYTQFVKEHIGSAPGKTQKDKMRAVALLWRRHKGKGKGLTAPGVRGGTVRDWSDYGDKPAFDGEGLWDDVKSTGKKVLKTVAKKAVDYAHSKAPALISKVTAKHPRVGALLQKAFDYGGTPLKNLIHKKIEGLGIVHARTYLKHHMTMHPPKGSRRGGALSGLVSARQMAALRKHIRGSM